jgi:hypothetical protein
MYSCASVGLWFACFNILLNILQDIKLDFEIFNIGKNQGVNIGKCGCRIHAKSSYGWL